jgi:hypothetical protein
LLEHEVAEIAHSSCIFRKQVRSSLEASLCDLILIVFGSLHRMIGNIS